MGPQKIDAFMKSACATIDSQGVSRLALDSILGNLMELAKDRQLWSEENYADPAKDEAQARYLVREDADTGFALYLNVMRPGKRIPPHNHTTWACIAAVDGAEHNKLYERTDGGKGPGPATLATLKEIDLRPGHGIAMMPDDIHSVEINGVAVIRHLHFYGKPLETLSDRLTFDVSANMARIMDIGVKTKVGKAG